MDRTKNIINAIIQNEIIQRDIIKNTDAVWNRAHSYLWNKFPFSHLEIKSAKNHIKKYFEEIIPGLYFNYKKEKVREFTIRIVLAEDYIKRKSGRFIPHPVIWFNPNNPHGFAGTKKWFTNYMEKIKYENIRFYHENGKMIIRKDSNGFKNSSN